jgi:hypothetical protein
MNKKWYALFPPLCGAVISLAAIGSDDPGRMGYRRIPKNDEAIVALLAQRVVQGLQTNDPYLYSNFLIENLNKLAPNAEAIKYDLEIEQGSLSVQFVKQGERWYLLKTEALSTLAQQFANSAHVKLKKNSPGEKSFALLNESKKEDKTFVGKELSPEYGITHVAQRYGSG